jgi:hypothetical protein
MKSMGFLSSGGADSMGPIKGDQHRRFSKSMQLDYIESNGAYMHEKISLACVDENADGAKETTGMLKVSLLPSIFHCSTILTQAGKKS